MCQEPLGYPKPTEVSQKGPLATISAVNILILDFWSPDMISFCFLSHLLLVICLSSHRKLDYITFLAICGWAHLSSDHTALPVSRQTPCIVTDTQHVNVCQRNISLCPRRLMTMLDVFLEVSYL